MSEIENKYNFECMKCHELEKNYMMKNKKKIQTKKNRLLSMNEKICALNDANLAKQALDQQKIIVKCMLDKDKPYHDAYVAFKLYIENKHGEDKRYLTNKI